MDFVFEEFRPIRYALMGGSFPDHKSKHGGSWVDMGSIPFVSSVL
jgi:hypothetical protein